MTIKLILSKVVMGVLLAGMLSAQIADAQNRTVRRVSPGLREKCPRVIEINQNTKFFKNNKPLRAGPQIDAPVIGYIRQMTLANNAGVSDSIGSRVVTMYDRRGRALTQMIPYPCRSDHCGGRVVSVSRTETTRRIAVARTNSPAGFIKVTNRLCIKIPDIGRCYGDEVDKGRPLCNQTVG